MNLVVALFFCVIYVTERKKTMLTNRLQSGMSRVSYGIRNPLACILLAHATVIYC